MTGREILEEFCEVCRFRPATIKNEYARAAWHAQLVADWRAEHPLAVRGYQEKYNAKRKAKRKEIRDAKKAQAVS